MMKYSLLCACVTLAWWAGGSVGVTSATTTTRSTPKSPPPTRPTNFTALIIKNPSLTISLGEYNYTLNWTNVVKVIPAELVQKMWEESNVTESLWFTLNKFTDVWKNDKAYHNFTGNFTEYVCNVSGGQPTYNVSYWNVKNITDFRGNFGIQSQLMQRDVLGSVNYVLRPQHATHNVFYTTRDYNAYFSVFFGDKDTQMLGYVTADFAYVTTVALNNGTFKFLTVMLGYTARLPVLKGHLLYKTDIVVAQNEKFSMVLLTTFLDYNFFESRVSPNFSKIFKELTKEPPVNIIRRLENKMVEFEVTQTCPIRSLNHDTFEYVLEMGLVHFMAVAGVRDSGVYTRVECFSKLMQELKLLRFMTKSCFTPFYFKGFTSNHLSTVAGAMVYHTPINKLCTLTHQERNDVLVTLQQADNIQEMTNMIVWAAAEIINCIYTDYTNSFSLTTVDREHLLHLFLLLKDKERHHHIIYSTNLMLIYLMAGSMCNSVEISTVTGMLSDKRSYNLRDTFSPCLMSLRYDFTQDKLLSESKLVSNRTYEEATAGALGFFKILTERHVASFSLLPVSECLSQYADKVLMVIPMYNITYVVATEPLKEGINYEVKDTFIQKTIVVSAVMSNCTKFPDEDYFPRTIPIVYNITRSSSECPMCGAAFVSYDERDGLESMMFVSNSKVERNLFSDKSPFFDTQNMHTHYLMLFNNGTVIEIRGRYRERTAKFIIISLFILTLLFGAFLAFKIFVYCC
nr:envelope glycoprotein H [Equid gammaherpesvirus 5]UTK45547.1 envelope glycoprotein H [Equid gammaherpesvirus 5]UTK45626.1 envelope glycoprotein H [Equid gammaherpesvirus 5]UTK45705.1 envelope glycoprotein H [Equid gammaherpesvirus 5]